MPFLVITSLEREASERHDAQALGLATFVKSYQFVATLLKLSDVLPPPAYLCFSKASFGSGLLDTLTRHDSPTSVNDEKLRNEWHMFRACYYTAYCTLGPHEMMATIVKKETLASVFPNMYNLAVFAQLVRASSAECERGFSALKRIKTPLQNLLCNEVTEQLLSNFRL